MTKKILAAALAAIFLFAAGCGLIADPSQTGAATPAPTEEVVKRAGGDLLIAMPAEADSFDPYTTSSEGLINLLSLVYEPPLRYNADGSLENCLVESWEADAGKTAYTFKLRGGVSFTDGSQLTADDVIYSAKQVMALDGSELSTAGVSIETGNTIGLSPDQPPEEGESAPPSPSPSPSASPSAEASASPSQSAAPAESATPPELSRYAQYNQYIASMERVDDSTVRLTLNTPGNWALHFMTFPVVKTGVDFSLSALPIGTGPYAAESYTAEDGMHLTANEAWWGGSPYISRIIAKPVTEPAQELEYVSSSLIDLATTDALYAGKYKKPGTMQVIDYMTNYYDCLIPNLITPELKDVNVRQAISYALDRRELLSTVLLNHGVPTNLPIAPDFYAYDSKYKISDYDSKTARDLLKESGYRYSEDSAGNILMLDMIVANDPDEPYRKEAAKAVKKQLAEVGIEINVVEAEPAEYRQLLETGNYDLAYCSFFMDINPNLAFLFDPEGSGNYGHVQSEEISAAIAACNMAVTEEERKAAYTELQRVLTERVPQIGLYFRMNSIVCDEAIQGIVGARENMVYAKIQEWYLGSIASVAPAESTAPETAEAEETPPSASETVFQEDEAGDGAGITVSSG